MAFMGLFLLPFGAVGIGTAAKGVQRVAQGNWHERLALLLFGLDLSLPADRSATNARPSGWRLL